MKRKLLAMAMTAGSLAAGILPLSAQSTVVDNPDNRSYFGLRTSFDLACPTDVDNKDLLGCNGTTHDPGAGVSIGAMFHLPIVANFYFEPELDLYYNTYKLKTSWGWSPDTWTDVSGSTRKFGARLPLQLGYHFDFSPKVSLAVFTGPELDVAFWGRKYQTPEEGSDRNTRSASLYKHDDESRFDCLWRIGAGVNISRHYYIGVSGSIGMCNMLRDTSAIFHQNIVRLTLGYNF